MNEDMDIWWEGSSLNDLRRFPGDVRHALGFQLFRVQSGELPADWKPLKNLGKDILVCMKFAYRLIRIFTEAHTLQNLATQWLCFTAGRRRRSQRRNLIWTLLQNDIDPQERH